MELTTSFNKGTVNSSSTRNEIEELIMINKFKQSTIKIIDIHENERAHDQEESPITKAEDSSTQIRVKLQHNTSIKHCANNIVFET